MTKIHNGENNHSSTNLYLAATRCLIKSNRKTCWNNDRLNLRASECLKLSDWRKFQNKPSTGLLTCASVVITYLTTSENKSIGGEPDSFIQIGSYELIQNTGLLQNLFLHVWRKKMGGGGSADSLKHCISSIVPDDAFIIQFKPLRGKDYPLFTDEDAKAQRVQATCYPLLSSKCSC